MELERRCIGFLPGRRVCLRRGKYKQEKAATQRELTYFGLQRDLAFFSDAVVLVSLSLSLSLARLSQSSSRWPVRTASRSPASGCKLLRRRGRSAQSIH